MENRNLLKLITPSWLSGFIGGAVAILVTSAGIVISRYQGSELQQQIFENQANAAANGTANGVYENITANIANNSLLNTVPMLLTWAAVGLVIYYLSVSIGQSMARTVDLREQMEYVHSSRQELMRQATRNTLVRLAAVIAWFVLIKLTIGVFVPYALAAASIAGDSLSFASAGYALLAMAILFGTVQLHAIVLRLIALRPRLFGN
jgi:hypothetical protein